MHDLPMCFDPREVRDLLERDTLSNRWKYPLEKHWDQQFILVRVFRVDARDFWISVNRKYDLDFPITSWWNRHQPPRVGDRVQILATEHREIDHDPPRHFYLAPPPQPFAWFQLYRPQVGQCFKSRVLRQRLTGFHIDLGTTLFLPNALAHPTLLENPEDFRHRQISLRATTVDHENAQLTISMI